MANRHTSSNLILIVQALIYEKIELTFDHECCKSDIFYNGTKRGQYDHEVMSHIAFSGFTKKESINLQLRLHPKKL
jgi:hypothetical protein